MHRGTWRVVFDSHDLIRGQSTFKGHGPLGGAPKSEVLIRLIGSNIRVVVSRKDDHLTEGVRS